jgi:hypothetical protein
MMCEEKKRHRYVRPVLDILLYLLGRSLLNTMAKFSVADPDPGSGVFFYSWIRDRFFPRMPDPEFSTQKSETVHIWGEKEYSFLLIGKNILLYLFKNKILYPG